MPVRQRSARSANNIAATHASVEESLNVFLTHCSLEFGISVMSLQQILRTDLGLHPKKNQMTIRCVVCSLMDSATT